jgi:antimicrobial peptide system SdpB family protein
LNIVTRLATKIKETLDSWRRMSPWTNTLGLARSILALATFLTLVCNPLSTLLRPVVGVGGDATCVGVGGKISAFCVVPAAHWELLRVAMCALLLLVIAGYRPRWTCIPHWWVCFSVWASIRTGDGGDQAASVLTLLLMPLCLTDDRIWHWQTSKGGSTLGTAIGLTTALAIRVQVSVIYLVACIAKFGVPEWDDGTSLYYWMNSNYFGLPHFLRPLLDPVLASPAVAFVTWSVLVLEFLLGIQLVLGPNTRRVLLLFGFLFHIGIVVLLGIASFGLVMVAALLLSVPSINWNLQDLFPVNLKAKRRLVVAGHSAMAVQSVDG